MNDLTPDFSNLAGMFFVLFVSFAAVAGEVVAPIAAGGTEPLAVRTFHVESYPECMEPPVKWETPEQREENNARWRELLSAGGVTWPEGAYLCHVPALGGIVVKNTAANLAIIAPLLRPEPPIPVRVSAQLWAIAPKAALELGLDTPPPVLSAEQWADLKKQLAAREEATFLACPTIVARNHEEATLEVMGDCDEALDVGGRLQVVPSVERGDDRVSLQFEVTYSPPPIMPGEAATNGVVAACAPAFKVNSALSLRAEEVAVFGGLPVEGGAAEGRLVFAFLAASRPR